MIPTAILTMGDKEDMEFIRDLFLRNERVMYGMAMKLVKEHYTACDMVSASCIQMIEKVNYLREIDPRKQTPYILSIVKNTSLMYLRQRRSESIYLTADEKTLDWITHFSEDVDDALICEAESQMLRSALKRLKPKERELLEMKYFSQLKDKEIARQLGIAGGSVRYYLTLARRALKAELKKEDDSLV